MKSSFFVGLTINEKAPRSVDHGVPSRLNFARYSFPGLGKDRKNTYTLGIQFNCKKEEQNLINVRSEIPIS